jgi:hypothetical protein
MPSPFWGFSSQAHGRSGHLGRAERWKLYDPSIMSLGGGGAAILLEALIRIKAVISMSDTSLDPCLELGLFSTLM